MLPRRRKPYLGYEERPARRSTDDISKLAAALAVIAEILFIWFFSG